MGLVASPPLIAARWSVGWAERGVVTGTSMFSRSIGSAVGVALFGAIANAVLSAGGRADESLAAVNPASHHVFIAVLTLSAVMAASALMLPRHRDQVVV